MVIISVRTPLPNVIGGWFWSRYHTMYLPIRAAVQFIAPFSLSIEKHN
jgi:hypothetical protein